MSASQFTPGGAGNVVAVKHNHATGGKKVPSGKSPVYQIDFSAVACGSRIASTKRKIRWRFGFTNLEALDAGLTGLQCRGEEHDVSLVWSIASGKRILHVDQQEVHYSNSRNGVFEFSWTMRGNHVLKVHAYASPPISATPGFRQYDFFVDGQSFFTFPKVFRLNMMNSNNTVDAQQQQQQQQQHAKLPYAENGMRRGSDQPVWKLEEPQTEQEEFAILQETINQSLNDDKKELEDKEKEAKTQPRPEAPPQPVATNDLLDFFSAPQIPAIQRTNSDPGAPEASTGSYMDSAVSFAGTDSAPAFAVSHQQPQQQQQQPNGFHNQYQTTENNSWAQQQQQQQQPQGGNTYDFASAPTQYPTTSSSYSQSTYDPSTSFQSQQSYTSTNTPYNMQPAAAAVQNNYSYNQSAGGALTYGQMKQPSTPTQATATPTPAPTPAAPAAPVVTLDNYHSLQAAAAAPVAPPQPTLDLNVGSTLADKAYLDIANNFSLSLSDTKESNRSNPFDTPSSISGPKPTLAGLKTSKPESAKKEVMKNAAAPNAIIMSNTQQGNWGLYSQYAGQNQAGMQQQQQPYGGYANYNQGYGVQQGYPPVQQQQYNPQQPQQQQQQQYNPQQHQQPPYAQQQQTQYQQQTYPQQQQQQQQQQQHYGGNQFQSSF